jgi:hypothetical protein
MKRRLLNFLTALSLLLCAAVCILWARSRFAYERMSHHWLAVTGTAWDWRYVEAGQTRGVVWLRAGRTVQPRADGDERDALERDTAVSRYRDVRRLGWWRRQPANDFVPRDSGSPWQRMGFHAEADSGNGRYRSWGADVTAPHWALALLCGVLPAARLVRLAGIRARRRHTPGLCRGCGYDLRASPGRCPECGTARDGPV